MEYSIQVCFSYAFFGNLLSCSPNLLVGNIRSTDLVGPSAGVELMSEGITTLVAAAFPITQALFALCVLEVFFIIASKTFILHCRQIRINMNTHNTTKLGKNSIFW